MHVVSMTNHSNIFYQQVGKGLYCHLVLIRPSPSSASLESSQQPRNTLDAQDEMQGSSSWIKCRIAIGLMLRGGEFFE